MVDRPYRSRSRAAAALLATLPFALVAAPLAAQSYAVVQPVPAPASGELSAALQRLARNPTDFDALVAAGRASLASTSSTRRSGSSAGRRRSAPAIRG
jgi:hypothetical protein